MPRKQPELTKPNGISYQTWVRNLLNERRDMVRQSHREVQSNGNRIDRAIARAILEIARGNA